MAGDFNKPVVTDAYASVLQSVKDLIADLAKGLDGTGTANIPTNAIRWSSANSRFEKYNGSSWAALSSNFAMDVASVAGRIPGYAAGNLPYLDASAKVPLNNLYMGAGSGLNADQLDGLDSTAFARRDYLANQSMADASAAVDTGVRFSYIASTNKPSGTDHGMMTMAYSSAWAVQLAGDWRTNEWYVRNENNTIWGAWARLLHSANAPGALNAQAAGTYGGMNITGANNGWAGFQFNSTSRYFMSSSGQTGEYDTSSGAWQWRWDSGTLAVGTVPWARLSGVPAMSFLGLGGGTLTGPLISATNTAAFNSANETTLSVRGSTGAGAIMSFHRAGAYAINMGLDTDNYFKIGGWSAGSPVFQLTMAGQLWLSNYGWLHDYFTRTVNAGYYLEGGGSGPNLTISHAPGFSGSGAPGSITISGGHITAASFNCNCNCSNG